MDSEKFPYNPNEHPWGNIHTPQEDNLIGGTCEFEAGSSGGWDTR